MAKLLFNFIFKVCIQIAICFLILIVVVSCQSSRETNLAILPADITMCDDVEIEGISEQAPISVIDPCTAFLK